MADDVPPNQSPAMQAFEEQLLADLADAGGVAESSTESERTRFVDPLQAMRAIEKARELAGVAPRRQRARLGTSYLAYRSSRRGF